MVLFKRAVIFLNFDYILVRFLVVLLWSALYPPACYTLKKDNGSTALKGTSQNRF